MKAGAALLIKNLVPAASIKVRGSGEEDGVITPQSKAIIVN